MQRVRPDAARGCPDARRQRPLPVLHHAPGRTCSACGQQRTVAGPAMPGRSAPRATRLRSGDLTGISVSTAERWSQWAKRDWAAYVGQRTADDRRDHSGGQKLTNRTR
jgi:hypothetical protein